MPKKTVLLTENLGRLESEHYSALSNPSTRPYSQEILIRQLRSQFEDFVQSADPLELWAMTDVLMTRQAAYGYPEAGIVGAFHEFLQREERNFFMTEDKQLADAIRELIITWKQSNGKFRSGTDKGWRLWTKNG